MTEASTTSESTTAQAPQTTHATTTPGPTSETSESTTSAVGSTVITSVQSDQSTASPVVVTTIQTISGSVVQQTYTTTPSPTATGATGATGAPSLSSGDSGSSSSGLNTGAKNTIIGVVVGVGGAILLLGIGAVAWRIWGRKKSPRDNDEDDLMSAGTAVGSGSREKAPSPGAAGTPFKSTLDQYHSPGPVNAASNF
jgi:hypothetical protein